MYQNPILSVFIDVAKFADFRLKNADVSRTQGMCHVIFKFFGSSLNSQIPLSMREVLSQFYLKCLLKYFFFKFVDNLTNLLNCYSTYILQVSTTDFLVFFSEQISRTAILTQALLIICKYDF